MQKIGFHLDRFRKNLHNGRLCFVDFISKQSTNPWYLLEFSSLGFIGKLFRARDLPSVVEFLLMFHREKPVDWLLDHIFYVRLCHPEKSNKQCQQTKNKYRIRYKPSLFQHIGVHSSLKGKVQKLKERDFGKQPLHKSHENPPADVSTSLKTYQKYTIDGAYKGETFFWGKLKSDLKIFLEKIAIVK